MRITRDDGDQCWRLAELFRRSEMNRIERAHWFDWERTAGASEHRVGDRHQIASSREELERPNCRPLVSGIEPAGRPGTDEGS